MRKTGVRVMVTVLLAVLMSGCAVRLIYNQLDWLIPWYLGDYIKLEGPQKELFKDRLEDYLQWHRREQLPLYADFLERAAAQAEKGMTEAEIAATQLRSEELAQALVLRLQPDMIELFALASDEQIDRLFKKFNEDHERYLKDYVQASPNAQRKRRAKEARQYVERWTGSLRKEQRALIDAWADDYELMGEELAQTRMAWQDEFQRILAMRHDRPAYDQAFARLLENPTYGRSERLQQKFDRNQQALVTLYQALDRTLSDGQRNRMVKKLQRYARDFRHLSTQ